MNAWPFVTAAYVLTLAGAGAIAFASYAAMRAAEKKAP